MAPKGEQFTTCSSSSSEASPEGPARALKARTLGCAYFSCSQNWVEGASVSVRHKTTARQASTSRPCNTSSSCLGHLLLQGLLYRKSRGLPIPSLKFQKLPKNRRVPAVSQQPTAGNNLRSTGSARAVKPWSRAWVKTAHDIVHGPKRPPMNHRYNGNGQC